MLLAGPRAQYCCDNAEKIEERVTLGTKNFLCQKSHEGTCRTDAKHMDQGPKSVPCLFHYFYLKYKNKISTCEYHMQSGFHWYGFTWPLPNLLFIMGISNLTYAFLIYIHFVRTTTVYSSIYLHSNRNTSTFKNCSVLLISHFSIIQYH